MPAGGLYTRGVDGLYSFSLHAYNPTLGIGSTSGEVLAAGGNHPQDVSSVSVAYTTPLAAGSWIIYVNVNSYGWTDSHWVSWGYYDEEGNWVEEDDEWQAPETGGTAAYAAASLPVTISNGGSTPQTITWTSPPLSPWPHTHGAPVPLGATCSSGAPVIFSIGPGSGNPADFAFSSGTLRFVGGVGYAWQLGFSWTVLAEAPASATHAYASTLFTITLDRGLQVLPSAITGPTISNTGFQSLSTFSSFFSGAYSSYTAPTYQLIGGGGTITGSPHNYTYYPNGYVGPVSIRARVPGSDLFYDSNDCVITFATAVPTVVPAITSHPAGTSAWVGGTVNLAVAASGAPTPTYQWRKNGADLAGATAATLTLANVQVADSGTYVAVATNSVGTAQSNPATVTISNPPPTIATQPASRTTYAGESVRAVCHRRRQPDAGLPMAERRRRDCRRDQRHARLREPAGHRRRKLHPRGFKSARRRHQPAGYADRAARAPADDHQQCHCYRQRRHPFRLHFQHFSSRDQFCLG
jgi:hypothetical protein